MNPLFLAPVAIIGAALLFMRKGSGGGTLRGVERPGGGRIADKRDPAPGDVIELPKVGGGTVPVHKGAAAAYAAMRAAWIASGGDARRLGIHSGYRSTATQTRLFAQAVARYGSEAEARKWVAKPGGSAHHSGRALDLDLDGGDIGSGAVARLRKSAAWLWLQVNAPRFGFYPYEVEPWHWEWNPPA